MQNCKLLVITSTVEEKCMGDKVPMFIGVSAKAIMEYNML